MISTTTTKGKREAVTSDLWHVVHARWFGRPDARPFVRQIVSEHDDRKAAERAARALATRLRPVVGFRQAAERDQVFVRPPRFKTLKQAARRAGGAGHPD